MLPGYAYVLIATCAILGISVALNLILISCYLQLRCQRDVLHKNLCIGLYEPMPRELIEVLDQIEGVKEKKKEKN